MVCWIDVWWLWRVFEYRELAVVSGDGCTVVLKGWMATILCFLFLPRRFPLRHYAITNHEPLIQERLDPSCHVVCAKFWPCRLNVSLEMVIRLTVKRLWQLKRHMESVNSLDVLDVISFRIQTHHRSEQLMREMKNLSWERGAFHSRLPTLRRETRRWVFDEA